LTRRDLATEAESKKLFFVIINAFLSRYLESFKGTVTAVFDEFSGYSGCPTDRDICWSLTWRCGRRDAADATRPSWS